MIVIRPVAEADADAIAAFFTAAGDSDPVVGALSAEEWRRFAALPQNRNGRDFRLAVDDGAIAGVATPSLRDHETPWVRHFRIVVAPERRRRGIGGFLLRHIAEMDAPHAATLQCLCPEGWEATAAFLEAAGFAVLENELDMLCGDAGAERSVRRREVTVRAVADPTPLAAALADIHNRAYAGTPSFVRLTADAMAAMFPPEAVVLVAEQRGAVLGYCHLEIGAGEGWIDTVVVDPRRQRQGIGAALMIEAMAEAARRGRPRIRLSVSDRNAPAYVLYRHLGFAVVAKSARYRADRETVLRRLAARDR